MSTTSGKNESRLFAIFLTLIMICSIFALISASDRSAVYGAGETAKVTADLLNVRAGAGTTYSAIGSLSRGKTFTVTGSAKDKYGVKWYKLTYKNRVGYVSSKYVDIKQVTVTAVSNLKGTVKADGGLNVRSGPGTKYGRLGMLANGKTFAVTGKAKAADGIIWYQLTYSSKKGYVSSQYIKTSQAAVKPPAEETESSSKPVTVKIGTVTANDGLNVRSGAGTGYSILTVLDKGACVSVTGSKKADNGKLWYSYQYSGTRAGYICSDYVSIKSVTSDGAFEKHMTDQKFPESYKTGLRILHAAHPSWVFKAVNVGYSWSEALSDESKVGRNLVSPTAPKAYRSKAKGAYNSSTGVYTKFDTGWYSADSKVIAYYMDPRNFLSENGIYQFMTHRYDSKTQNEATVKAVIKDSFMEGANPGGGYSSYQSLINAAGKAAGVNPNVLAAMIIQEQGWKGSSLCFGTYSGYKGYYNFFNIGAYATGSMNAIQRGLWYAKGPRAGEKPYSRPWNTRYSSIKGGAEFYADEYVCLRQDSYYTKKFNVKNGIAKVGVHQYMTNVAGAASEGSIVKRAYSSTSSYPVVFEIPVFGSMPSSACVLP